MGLQLLIAILAVTLPDQHVADSLTEQAASLESRGLDLQAEADLRRALQIREAGFDPGSIQVAMARNNLGAIEQILGHLDEAQRLHAAAFATAERVFAPNDPALIPYLTHQATLEKTLKHLGESEKLLNRALGLAQAGRNNEQERHVWTYLGELYGAQNRFEQAEDAYKKALSGYQAASPSDRLDMVGILNHLLDRCRAKQPRGSPSCPRRQKRSRTGA
jgi:tetratricopeptide (TPR) repeat protein